VALLYLILEAHLVLEGLWFPNHPPFANLIELEYLFFVVVGIRSAEEEDNLHSSATDE
jgi:hypothetical protein